MSRSEKTLVWLFRINGVLLLAAWPAVFFPTSWMASIHEQVGLGEMPEAPIVEYLARSASGIYGLLGIACLLIASDVRRYAPFVTLAGLSFLLFGVLMLLIDFQVRMPTAWTYLEGPLLIPLGLIILSLQRRLAV